MKQKTWAFFPQICFSFHFFKQLEWSSPAICHSSPPYRKSNTDSEFINALLTRVLGEIQNSNCSARQRNPQMEPRTIGRPAGQNELVDLAAHGRKGVELDSERNFLGTLRPTTDCRNRTFKWPKSWLGRCQSESISERDVEWPGHIPIRQFAVQPRYHRPGGGWSADPKLSRQFALCGPASWAVSSMQKAIQPTISRRSASLEAEPAFVVSSHPKTMHRIDRF